MISKRSLMMKKANMGFYKKELCSKIENEKYKKLYLDDVELPDNIFFDPDYPSRFIRIIPNPEVDECLEEYLFIKQTELLHTIRNCVVYFAVILTLSLIGILLTLSI